jgi:hypothetical protein
VDVRQVRPERLARRRRQEPVGSQCSFLLIFFSLI